MQYMIVQMLTKALFPSQENGKGDGDGDDDGDHNLIYDDHDHDHDNDNDDDNDENNTCKLQTVHSCTLLIIMPYNH